MSNPSESADERDRVREKLIGLGDLSIRKSYYPELQKRLEELERFHALLEESNDAIFLVEVPSGEIIDLNESASRQLGWSRENFLTFSIFDVTDLKQLTPAVEMITGDFPEVRRMLAETLLHVSDGSRVAAEITLNRRAFGSREYVVAVARDIRERKRAELAMRLAFEKEEHARRSLDAIISSVADGLIVVDNMQRIVLINPCAEKMLGVVADEVKGRVLESVVTEEVLVDQVKSFFQAELVTGPVDLPLSLDSGADPLVVEAHSGAVLDKNGEIRAVVILLRDVTQARQFDLMKSEFISRAAHELRTPLTSILGFAEMLLDDEEYPIAEEDRREALRTILGRGEHLAEIIDDLLDLSRIKTGHPGLLKKEGTDLLEIVESVLPSFRKTSPRHHFQVALKPGAADLAIDRGKIMQVLENLLNNAVKYAPDGGRVLILGEEIPGNFYRMTIKDEGIGLTPFQASRVFEQFYRVDNSSTAVGGLGLGLTIARNIVEAHGGKIWIQSSPGEGTAVHFTLPKR